MADKKYCYPNSNVLKNKFEIKDSEELRIKERFATTSAILSIQDNPVKGNFDLKHLQAVHKAIFDDLYEWAGEIRTIDIAKSNLFCRVQFLDSYAQDIFERLKKDKYLIGMDKEQTIKKLAEYMGDINALHPFREGNGRTQREFICYLSKATGIELDLDKVDSDRMMEASLKSFKVDYSGFQQIFSEIARPMSLEAQENFLMDISPKAYREFEDLKQKKLLPNRQVEFAEQKMTVVDDKDVSVGNLDKKETESRQGLNDHKRDKGTMSDYMKEIEREKEKAKEVIKSGTEKSYSKSSKER